MWRKKKKLVKAVSFGFTEIVDDGKVQKLYLTLTLRTNYKAITVIYHELNNKPLNRRTLHPRKTRLKRKLSLVPLN